MAADEASQSEFTNYFKHVHCTFQTPTSKDEGDRGEEKKKESEREKEGEQYNGIQRKSCQ